MITSPRNALLRHARDVRDGKNRELIFIEGLRLSEEAVASGLEMDDVIYAQAFANSIRNKQLMEALGHSGVRLTSISDSLLSALSDTKTSQGIILLARRPSTGLENLKKTEGPHLIILIHGVGNPSNAGAILRVAEAAGSTGVITTQGTCDLFSPKALRGAMGSSFRLPVWTGATYEEAMAWCAAHAVRTAATAVRAQRLYTDPDWRKPYAIVVGDEGFGLARDEIKSADESIRIPMSGLVESLNVSVAVAIVAYEAARQRSS